MRVVPWMKVILVAGCAAEGPHASAQNFGTASVQAALDTAQCGVAGSNIGTDLMLSDVQVSAPACDGSSSIVVVSGELVTTGRIEPVPVYEVVDGISTDIATLTSWEMAGRDGYLR